MRNPSVKQKEETNDGGYCGVVDNPRNNDRIHAHRATNSGPTFSLQEAFDFVECTTWAGDASDVIARVDDRFGT